MSDSSSNAAFSAGVKLVKSQPRGTTADALDELFDVYTKTFAILNAFDRACYKNPDPERRRAVLFVESSDPMLEPVWSQLRRSRKIRLLTPMVDAALSEYKNRRRKCDGALRRHGEGRYRSIPIPSTEIAGLVLKQFRGVPEPSVRNTDVARLIRDRDEKGTYFLRVPVMKMRTQSPDPKRDDVGVYFGTDGLYAVAEDQQCRLTAAMRFSAERASAKKFAQHFFRVMATVARQVSVEIGNELGGEAARCRRVFLRYGRKLNAEGVLAVRPVATSRETAIPTVCPRCGAAVSHASLSDALTCKSCELQYRRQHVLASWALTEGRHRAAADWSVNPNDARDGGTVTARKTTTPNASTHTTTTTTTNKTEAVQELKGPVKPGRSMLDDDEDGLIYAYQPSYKEAVRARANLVDTRIRAGADTHNGKAIRDVSQVELAYPVVVELDRTSKGLVDPPEPTDEAEQVHHASSDCEIEYDEEIIAIYTPDPNVIRDPLTGEVIRRRPR